MWFPNQQKGLLLYIMTMTTRGTDVPKKATANNLSTAKTSSRSMASGGSKTTRKAAQ